MTFESDQTRSQDNLRSFIPQTDEMEVHGTGDVDAWADCSLQYHCWQQNQKSMFV